MTRSRSLRVVAPLFVLTAIVCGPIWSRAADRTTPDRLASLGRAIDDLAVSFPDRYPNGPAYRDRWEKLRARFEALASRPNADAERNQVDADLAALEAEALLANPLLDFDRLLFVDRSAANLGLPANWQSNSSLATKGFDNRIAVLSPVRPGGTIETLYQPDGGRFVGDLDLHPSADRMLVSMPGANGRWQVHELKLDGTPPRELPLIAEPDVDNYDACYLPDDRVLFTSTATFLGVPCVYGNSHVTNLYVQERDQSIRQLTVDQEHDWCPTPLNDGRILYLRWEYTGLPHSNSRRLFAMNPDGTGQMAFVSSGSYFPNSFFYARPVPGSTSKVVGIATGHHGNARSGRLLILDPRRGQREAEPVVQEIPGFGKTVEPLVRDELADGVWPQFLHPYPLSEKYFLVSMRPSLQGLWGIYLVDVFDNLLKLAEAPGRAFLEPVPVKARPVPPRVPDRVDRSRNDAVVFLSDVYEGGGLKGVPRGAVKKLRLVSYSFSYRGMGGLLGSIGLDGPWDMQRVLGTVPVEPDGSALFSVPASTPIAVQPLDEQGQALQLMRSWFTAMPGEVVSCAGCHEGQRSAPTNSRVMALERSPSEIAEWFGPPRGFSFAREVQPVLDRSCVRCHDGGVGDGHALPDLRGDRIINDWATGFAGHVNPTVGGRFSASYVALRRLVRAPGIESDIHMLAPMDFHASTTELVRVLRAGHHGATIDDEGWDRLITWIDLNTPFHGTWREMVGAQAVDPLAARARAMRLAFTGRDEDLEWVPPASEVKPIARSAADEVEVGSAGQGPGPDLAPAPVVEGWPFDAAEAAKRQGPAAETRRTLDLGGGVTLDLVRVPAGAFVMGDPEGPPASRPAHVVRIDRPYWVGATEVTNAQFARFDSTHDSHVESMHAYQFGIHGHALDGPNQPVVRVSWEQARAFCAWLSARAGATVDLPTEAQWEHACRAGTATPFSFGGPDADFAPWSNLGDARLKDYMLETYIKVRPVEKPTAYDDWVPKDDRFDDGSFVSAEVGRYRPNAWGLFDMHGNVWEWTRSQPRPYPYRPDDGRDEAKGPVAVDRVVRGGSWYDRPFQGTSSFRLSYRPYQGVYNVGFRVMMELEETK